MPSDDRPVPHLALWLTPLLVVGTGIVAAWQTQSAMSDDAFILLRVVRHWLEGEGPHYNPGMPPVQVVTSPLNLILTALVAFAGRLVGLPNDSAPIVAAQILHIVWTPLLLLSVYLLVLGGRRTAAAILGGAVGAAVAFFPAVYFTSGMETTMALALACFSLVAFQARRWALCSALLGLAFLARHDALLLAVIVTLLYAKREQTEDRFSAALSFATPFVLVVAPWLVASLLLYHSTTPETLAAKMAQGGTPYWPEPFYSGFSFFATWFNGAAFAWVAVVVAFVGLALAWRSRSAWAMGVWLLVMYHALHLLAYSMLGVPPYHWYYVGYGVTIGALVGAAVSCLRLPPFITWFAWGIPALTLYSAWDRLAGPWHSDADRYPYYRPVGEYLSKHPPERSVGLMEIGVIGYYAPAVTVFDFGGIATPSQRDRIARADATAWLGTDEAPDVVVIRGERHPLEPDFHPDFEKYYRHETTLDGGKAFEHGLQVWRRKDQP
jgi:hypothetical protein